MSWTTFVNLLYSSFNCNTRMDSRHEFLSRLDEMEPILGRGGVANIFAMRAV